MRSANAITHEIDDLEAAVGELAARVRGKIEFGSSTAVLVCCDPHTDATELGARLHEEFDTSVVGLTTTAMMDRHTGYLDSGIQICVMTGDDVSFAHSMTGPLTPENFASEIRAAYEAGAERLGTRPRILLAAAPFIRGIPSGLTLDALDDASGHVPIFGGVASDYYDMDRVCTFVNEHASPRTLGMMFIGGDISPVFSVGHGIDHPPIWRGTITSADGCKVHELSGRRFTDVIFEMVPKPDRSKDLLFYFHSTPFLVKFNEDEPAIPRVVVDIDWDDGAGIFMDAMPEGCAIEMRTMPGDAMERSSGATLDKLLHSARTAAAMTEATLIVCSCNSRQLLNGRDPGVEAQMMTAAADYHSDIEITAAGFYAFGEFCPTEIRPDGTARNRFHNVSFVTVAF